MLTQPRSDPDGEVPSRSFIALKRLGRDGKEWVVGKRFVID